MNLKLFCPSIERQDKLLKFWDFRKDVLLYILVEDGFVWSPVVEVRSDGSSSHQYFPTLTPPIFVPIADNEMSPIQ